MTTYPEIDGILSDVGIENEMLRAAELYDFCEQEGLLICAGTISQDDNQYDNYSIKLFQVQGYDFLLMVEDLLCDTNHYILSGDSAAIALKNTPLFLEQAAANWASNCEDEKLERYRWGLDEPQNDEVEEDYEGEVRIIKVGSFYGYTPMSYVEEEFESVEGAREWIEKEESGTYYLSHNEAGRPDYYILPV